MCVPHLLRVGKVSDIAEDRKGSELHTLCCLYVSAGDTAAPVYRGQSVSSAFYI